MAGLDVREKGGEACEGGCREEGLPVCGEEVVEGREEEAGCFLFGGEAQEGAVEGEDVVFAVSMRVSIGFGV